MDSPHTGCKECELLYINTPKFDLVIKGKPCHPKAETLKVNSDDISELKLFCKEECVVEVYNQQTIKCYYEIIKSQPIFYENQDYQIIIENKGNYNIRFWHDNNSLREKVGYIGKSNRILSGIINFKNEVGFSEFKIFVDDIDYLTIIIEIFPSKIDYKNDYKNILLDVNNEIYNLAFEFLKKTYFGAIIGRNTGNSLSEFFSIICIIFDRLKLAVDLILKNPHHILQHEKEILPYYKIKKGGNETLKWLQKNPHYIMMIENKYFPQRALVVNKNISYDTLENRFIKYILKMVVKKLESLKQMYLKLDRKLDDEIIRKIEYMQREIQRRVDTSFLKEVGEIYSLNSYSLVLNMAPGYKDVYKYYLMLIKGLSLNGDIFRISIKDLSLLYEYWCFIKLSSILKNKYKLINQDYIKINNSGVFVTLRKGEKASVTYENPKNGEKFTITYNPPMGELPTVSQKPDNVLTLEKERSKTKYQYIFDAKYRINPAIEGTYYKKIYNTPGPEEDDINTMHRYRDAIVYENKESKDFERTMFGAYVLFPYKDENEYKNHQFYKSIEKVNVGGLPFLPSATMLVQNFIQELIDDSPQSAFERTTLPNGLIEYIENIDFEKKDVLVGAVKNKEQFNIILKNRFYHIPYKRVSHNLSNLKYVALYQSKELFDDNSGIKYFGEINDWHIIKRRDIKEIPKSSDELYIKFEIKEWKQLINKIKPKEYGVRSHLYTNYKLLIQADCIPELCIKSKEEYRLYLEIKRLVDEVNICVSQDIVKGFKFNDTYIWIDEDKIKVNKNDKYYYVKVKDFNKQPRTEVKRIKEFITL